MGLHTDRRDSKRFALKLPALINQAAASNDIEAHIILTRDISNLGAYFHSPHSSSYEGRLKIELLIVLHHEADQTEYMRMTTTGEVVRREETGIAVRFDANTKLVPFFMDSIPTTDTSTFKGGGGK